jgi:GntR family transcriptional regulator, transcriptional repressor for pyruvate dehydrogenase complex
MAFEKISIPSAKECFFDNIKCKILSGELVTGQKLPSERELAEQTGINQSAVHLAIKDLERTGFVKIIPRHGTYVADYIASGNYDTLHEILRSGGQHMTRSRAVALVETRNAIEGGALIRLAACHTDSDIGQLEEFIGRFKTARGKVLSADELGTMTKDFHYLICKLSGNEVFILLMNSFTEISQRLWRHCAEHWGIDGLIEQSEHIVGLIKAGRGLDAQVYISEKFDEYVRDCGISL